MKLNFSEVQVQGAAKRVRGLPKRGMEAVWVARGPSGCVGYRKGA